MMQKEKFFNIMAVWLLLLLVVAGRASVDCDEWFRQTKERWERFDAPDHLDIFSGDGMPGIDFSMTWDQTIEKDRRDVIKCFQCALKYQDSAEATKIILPWKKYKLPYNWWTWATPIKNVQSLWNQVVADPEHIDDIVAKSINREVYKVYFDQFFSFL
jgi:hypothetical protein